MAAPAGQEEGVRDGLEVDRQSLDLVTFYARNLGVPERRNLNDPAVLQGKEVFYSPTPAGEAAVSKYREVRESCLVDNLDTQRNADIGEMAKLLRTMSGLYDQAARAATSL